MNKLEEFINSNNLTSQGVKIHSFEDTTHPAEDAAKLLGCSLSQIVKSLIIIVKTTERDIPMLVIVPGPKKLRQQAIRRVLKTQLNMAGILDSRLATREEVFSLTGYPVGGVPPISLEMQTITDSSVHGEKLVYGGGGATNTIVEIPTITLLQLTKPIVGDICTPFS